MWQLHLHFWCKVTTLLLKGEKNTFKWLRSNKPKLPNSTAPTVHCFTPRQIHLCHCNCRALIAETFLVHLDGKLGKHHSQLRGGQPECSAPFNTYLDSQFCLSIQCCKRMTWSYLVFPCYLKCTPAKWKFSAFFPIYQLSAMKMWNNRFYSLLHSGISPPHAVRTKGWHLCQQSQPRLQPVPGIPLTMERKLSINEAHILAQCHTEMQALIRMNTSRGDDKLDKW